MPSGAGPGGCESFATVGANWTRAGATASAIEAASGGESACRKTTAAKTPAAAATAIRATAIHL